MIKFSAVKSLDDIPEAYRGLFTLEGEELSLDETLIKTQKDLDNLAEAKRKEVADHNKTKQELSAYRKLNLSADEIEQRLQELEAKSGSTTEQGEKLRKALQDFKAKEKEVASLTSRLQEIEPEFERLKGLQAKAKVMELIDDELKGHKDVDADKTRRMLLKDVATGFISLDDTGTILSLKDNSKLGDYIDQMAKDFGFVVQNTPGVSRGSFTPSNTHAPGHKKFEVGAGGFLDDAALRQAQL